MIAKRNYNYYNSSDIFNTKTEPRSYQTSCVTPTKKKSLIIDKFGRDLSNDKVVPPTVTKNVIAASFRLKKPKDISDKITHLDRSADMVKKKPNLNIKTNDFSFLDCNNDVKTNYKKNIAYNRGTEISLGNDKQNYYSTTLNSSQDFAKKIIQRQKIEEKKNPKLKKTPQPLVKTPIKITKKLPSLTQKNTTGIRYDASKNAIANKIQLQKSNIFNDPEKDIMNRTFVQPSNTKEILKNTKTTKNKTTMTKNNIITNKEEVIPIKEKVKTTLKKNYTVTQTARERKLNDNKGHFPCKYDNYKPPPELPQTKSNVDLNRNKLFKNVTEKNRPTEVYEIDNIKSNKKFNMNEIIQVYRDNGLHIYGGKEDLEYNNGNVKGKAIFKIRTNNDDKKYNEKLKKAESTITKKQGVKIGLNKVLRTEEKDESNKNERRKKEKQWLEVKMRNIKKETEERKAIKEKEKAETPAEE